jgi:hypothetical protein
MARTLGAPVILPMGKVARMISVKAVSPGIVQLTVEIIWCTVLKG